MWWRSTLQLIKLHSSEARFITPYNFCRTTICYEQNRLNTTAAKSFSPKIAFLSSLSTSVLKSNRRTISSESKLFSEYQIGTQESEENKSEEIVKIFFVTPEGEEIEVQGRVGDNVLKLAVANDISCEGACEGQLACTTCHVYVDENYSEFIKEPVSEEEDLLDNAPFLKPNSRLSCQLTLTKELDGIRFTLPAATINFFVDGKVPKHH